MFKEISTSELNKNAFDMIDKEWFLLTAGDENRFNTMTCSWGTVGELWSKRVAISFVRKTRYTFEFTENSEYFTMSFFGDKCREALSFCGSKSGREYDKVKETNLTPVYDLAPYFEEAETVFICRKLYSDFIKPERFCDDTLDGKIYGLKDYHKFYVGEIVKVLVKE